MVILVEMVIMVVIVIESVVKEEDNPDYGTYYYADGDRRQDVMDVNFDLFGIIA